MTCTEKPSVKLYEPRTVSDKGFRIEDAAGVAIENCLNAGVHPRTLWGLLWGPRIENGIYQQQSSLITGRVQADDDSEVKQTIAICINCAEVAWGARGRQFKSGRPDHLNSEIPRLRSGFRLRAPAGAHARKTAQVQICPSRPIHSQFKVSFVDEPAMVCRPTMRERCLRNSGGPNETDPLSKRGWRVRITARREDANSGFCRG